jgi:pyridoxamine 5'-phosphate oxidase
MTLVTVDSDGQPAARVVLMRGFDATGFAFYTNTQSAKGRQLSEDSRVALCFHWDPLAEQVRVEGFAEPIADDEADRYWAGRPRESQIGAWASLQSQPLDSRETLQQRVAEFNSQFSGQDIPRPPHWSGYRVRPVRIEFWRGRDARLHERMLYVCTPHGWTRQMLYP